LMVTLKIYALFFKR